MSQAKVAPLSQVERLNYLKERNDFIISCLKTLSVFEEREFEVKDGNIQAFRTDLQRKKAAAGLNGLELSIVIKDKEAKLYTICRMK